MKKTKRQPEAKPEIKAAPGHAGRTITWWPWAAGVAALIVAFQIYAPALNGAFVLDDRYLPYFSAHPSEKFSDWVGLLRPLLMTSYWADYVIAGGSEPFLFHATNVLIHVLTSLMAALVIARLVEWAGVTGRMRAALAVFSGVLFLVHPLQVEDVAYTSGRSDALSTLFY